MEFLNKKGKGGTKRKEKEEGEERKGDGGKRVEGAAFARPHAPTERGENRVEGHDPRPPTPSAVNLLVGPELVGTDQPVPGRSVGQVEPSTATKIGPELAERRLRRATKSRPGPRSFKVRKGREEEEEELSWERNRSRSAGRDRSDGRDRSVRKEKRGEDEDEGKEERMKRKRDIGDRGNGAACPRPCGSGVDATDDDVATEELGPLEEDVGEAYRLPVEPKERLRVASAPSETSSRGRGRPPTTGDYVGLAAARREAAEAEERLLMVEAEKEVFQSGISRHREQRRGGQASGEIDPNASSPPRPIGAEDTSRRSVEDLGRGVNIAAGTIEKVASRSKNLKGTWVRELKEAAAETREVCGELSRRLQTEGDVPGLRAENAALRLRVEQLEGELRELRAAVEAMGAAARTPLPAPLRLSAAASALAVVPRERVGSADHGAPMGRMEAVDTTPPRSRSASLAGAAARVVGRKRMAPVITSSDDSDGESRGRQKKQKKGGSKTPPSAAKGGNLPRSAKVVSGGSPPVGGDRPPPPRMKRKAAEPPGGSNSDLLAQIEALMDAKLMGLRAEMGLTAGAARVQTAPRPRPDGNAGVDVGREGGATAPSRPAPPTARGRVGAPAGPTDTPPSSNKKRKRKRKGRGAGPPPAGQPQQPTLGGALQAAHLPPPPPATGEVPWTRVLGRRGKEAARKNAAGNAPGPAVKPSPGGGKGGGGPGQPGKRAAPRLPRTPGAAAITVTAPEGGGVTIGDAMSRVRQAIRVEDLGIEEVNPKRAATGGLILEVPGPESAEKADRLAVLMRGVLEGTGVRVARPTKRAEVRVQGLDDSITPEEVARAVALAGGCLEGDVRVGVARRAPTGLYAVWVQVPLSAARKLAESGRVRVGWVSARVEVLATRPLQCYRCLEVGHTRQRCTGEVDRSGRCYRCGAAEHRAAECSAVPKCPLCSDLGRPSNHRLGTACGTPANRGKRRRKAGAQPQVEEAPPATQGDTVRGAGPRQAEARAQPGGSGEAPKPQREKRQGGAAGPPAPI